MKNNMTEIIPSILVENFNELNEKLAKFINIAKTVQIDVCDGKFVSSISWPMNIRDKESVQSILEEENGMPEF